MAQTGTSRFTCNGCGRTYRWKHELAGKKVKCGCGNVMTAPEVPAGTVEMDPIPEDNGLYDLASDPEIKAKPKQHLPEGGEACPACSAALVPGAKICVQCGHNLLTGKQVATKVPPPKPATPSPAKSRVPVMPYGKAPVAAKDTAIGLVEGFSIKELYVPLALILVGLAIEFGYYMRLMPNATAGMVAASVWVGIDVGVNVVMMLIAILVAAKIGDMGFGHPLEAVMKLAAIAICVPAVADVVAHFAHVDFAGWAVSLLVYYLLFMWLFRLDFQDARICVLLVWGLSIARDLFVMGLIMSLLSR